jgi:hypothetical protein
MNAIHFLFILKKPLHYTQLMLSFLKLIFMTDQILVLFFIFILISAVGYFIGRNRRVGIFWSIYFSLFLTPIGGIIVTFISSKKADFYQPRSKIRIYLSYGALFLGSLLLLGSLISLINNDTSGGLSRSSQFNNLWISVGFIGIGIYTIITEKDNSLIK